MCFSATASFTAAAVLAVIGVFTIRANTREEWFLFALTPLLFAVQQFAEGVLWLVLQSGGYPVVESVATYVFLAFAIIGWPAYMTYALYRIESQWFRKRVLKALLVAALMWAMASTVYLLEFTQVAVVANNHILYQAAAPAGWHGFYRAAYGVLAVLPFFVTHERKLWMFGGLIGLSGAVSYAFYQTYLVSVWCFLAAVMSVYVYWVVLSEQENTLL